MDLIPLQCWRHVPLLLQSLEKVFLIEKKDGGLVAATAEDLTDDIDPNTLCLVGVRRLHSQDPIHNVKKLDNVMESVKPKRSLNLLYYHLIFSSILDCFLLL